MNTNILSILTFLPLIGAGLLYFLSIVLRKFSHEFRDILMKSVALAISLIVFILSLYIWQKFDPLSAAYQFEEKFEWISGYNIFYGLAIDGISLWFVLLTTFITPICILSSWKSVEKNITEYMICFLAMETFVIGSFLATDLLMFYILFEAVLIPMYLIIGIWGGDNRVYAAFKFFLYTLFGSLFLLLALVYIYLQSQTTYLPDLFILVSRYSPEIQNILWLAFFIAFAVKVPMWPVHTWLPDAHVQAPTAGSVMLAAVLLKLGGYGFIRFSLNFFPQACVYFADFVFWLSVIAVIYTSLVALMQEDMKKLIAYSSVAHMAYVTAGIFAMNQHGIEAAIFQMISHGIVSGALFICVGVLYDRMHTKEIKQYGGIAHKMPSYAFHFMIFMLASVGLPGTSGFIGEFVVLLAVFKVNKIYSMLLATGIVLGAAYMLWLYARVMFGKMHNEKLKTIHDLNIYEKISLWPITIMIFILGVYPNLIFQDLHISVEALVNIVKYM